MSDMISREAARLIALEYISDSMQRHGALEAIRALPAVQPTWTPPLTRDEAVKRMADDGDGDPEGTARLNYPHLFINNPGKEVMPSEKDNTNQPDTAPAGLSAGGGAAWLLMATAPKDGTWIILHSPATHTYTCIVARWDDIEEGWRERGDHYPCDPSHWMPLPAQPATEGGAWPTVQQAAQVLLDWYDDLRDPMAVGLAIAQSEEAYQKAMTAAGYEEAASSARARRFLESIARGNAKLIRSLTPPATEGGA